MRSILSKYNNLTQRIIAAFIGAILIIFGLWSGPYAFAAVFLGITIITQLEFYKLVGLDGMLPLKTFGSLMGGFIFLSVFLVESKVLPNVIYYLIFPLTLCVYLIYLYKKDDKKPFTGAAFTFLGILYIAVPFSFLNIIAFHSGYYHFELILGALLILWANDTGAYFAGVRFGKRKLFERISPKKSWEGSLGGLTLALAMSYAISQMTSILPTWNWLAIGVIVVIGGTYGDLVESLFKRSIEIKDSGRLIPGHGGFLDRFDGLLLAAPLIVAFLKIFC